MIAELHKIRELITSLDFWVNCLNSFKILGPLAPILLALLESLIPALPLVAIVTLNIAAHGTILGFLYSWIGTCLGSTIAFIFWRKIAKRFFVRLENKIHKIKQAKIWVTNFNKKALFFLCILPFTPSSFLNFAFGISDFDGKKYLITISTAKLIMIALLATFGHGIVKSLENPIFIILSLILLLSLWIISKLINKKHGL